MDPIAIFLIGFMACNLLLGGVARLLAGRDASVLRGSAFAAAVMAVNWIALQVLTRTLEPAGDVGMALGLTFAAASAVVGADLTKRIFMREKAG
jgi:hypothetical protein